ncbi:enoyl-CoA hydratase-related protein [Novosphingobium tardum]|uniref:Enoyl-CoA hydratase-related protein n=1 Tax=Novosphingobium tardum TaxID=1538021 RepID=A0ABV8RST2_9SPHN
MQLSNLLLVERRGDIAVVTINRPDRRNALGFGDDGDVVEAHLRELNADRTLRCVILTGAGTAFSAGGDLKQLSRWAHDASIRPPDFLKLYEAGIHKVVRGFWSLEMPVIAAINGSAIGLGNDLACLADMRLAAASAKFGATFLKIGLVPGDGGAWILPRIIGWERASELYFTGKIIDAPTALDWRLVGRVVADESLMDEAMAVAEMVCRQPPEVLRATKKLMRASILQGFEDIMSLSARYQVMAHLTDDHREALDAIHERRPPAFSGS